MVLADGVGAGVAGATVDDTGVEHCAGAEVQGAIDVIGLAISDVDELVWAAIKGIACDLEDPRSGLGSAGLI